MKSLVKIYNHPKLNTPIMLAAWSGVGNVALIIATYLRRKLDFKELGEVEASYFFDPVGVAVKDNVVQSPRFPENKFYYWSNSDDRNDIILFIGEEQPVAKGYELANCIVDAAVSFQVKRLYTCAAAITRIHHTEESKVWGVTTSQQGKEALRRHDLIHRGNLNIAGLNGLILGVAKERAIEGICLLGEVPLYATRIQNPMTALAVLRVLTEIIDIKIDITELEQQAQEMREKMREVASEAVIEYIDQFTEPIWEQNSDDGDEEDQEETE